MTASILYMQNLHTVENTFSRSAIEHSSVTVCPDFSEVLDVLLVITSTDFYCRPIVTCFPDTIESTLSMRDRGRIRTAKNPKKKQCRLLPLRL